MSINPLLYGSDSEERIVGIHREGQHHVRLYSRDDNDKVSSRREKLHPFIFVSDDGACVISESMHIAATVEAAGNGHLNNIIVFSEWSDLYQAKKLLYTELGHREFYSVTQAHTQYLMHSGKTLFKGMTPDDTLRMQVDIETYSSGNFPNAARPEDVIYILSMSDNRGWSRVLHLPRENFDLSELDPEVYQECRDERDLLLEFVKAVHQRDPDIIELHNGFGFDLPYIRDRAQRHRVNLALGRDNKVPFTMKGEKDFAERTFQYEQFFVGGRAIIDTMFLAIDYDVYKRDLPSYGLKAIAKHFGVSPEDRVHIEGDRLAWTWDNDPMAVLKYALDDVVETRGIGIHLCQAPFYLTQMVPMDYQRTHVAGKSAMIETLFIREYLKKRQSLPDRPIPSTVSGGYTEVFKRGVYHDLNYADVESLYPSIMLNFNIQPLGDSLLLFPELLQLLTDTRFEAKRRMKKLKSDGLKQEASVVDSQQAAYKILINSFYGMLGHRDSLFADFLEADRVTTTGRGLLKRMIHLIRARGGNVILVDTDGVLYELPRSGMTDSEVDDLVADISSNMPEGINIGNDGRFLKVLSYKPKNYVLVTDEGKVKFKGVSFKGRNMPPFAREYIKDVCHAILEDDAMEVYKIHTYWLHRIVNHEWDISEFRSRGALKKSLEEYENSLRGTGKRMAAYEIAIRQWEETGIEPVKGDIVYYYVSGHKTPHKVSVYVDAKEAKYWKRGDENGMYYAKKRLKGVAERFKLMFEENDFKKIFHIDTKYVNQQNLFGSTREEELLKAIKIPKVQVEEYPNG